MATNPWQPLAANAFQQPGTVQPVTPSLAPPLVPSTVTNTDGSTFNAMPAAPQQQSFGYTPTTRSVDPTKETVQGQFTGLMAQDNPLITMARTNAKQQMNAKGLLNSSMAISAADAAAYQAALPIASTDAATYGQAARENQAYGNEALKTNTGAQNDAAKNNLTAWIDTAKANMDSATKTQLATIEADYKTTMQSSASASELYKQAVKNMSDIMMNKDMDITAKNAAVQNQLYLLKSGMEISGRIGNLNLGGLLDFSATPMAAGQVAGPSVNQTAAPREEYQPAG